MRRGPGRAVVTACCGALLFGVAAGGCQESGSREPERSDDPREAALGALEALGGVDPEDLARWVHPERGLLFSPYPTVDPGEAVVLTPEEIRGLGKRDPVRLWGYHDGTGDPIRLSYADYRARFVLDRDFAAAPVVSVDERVGVGTSLDNLRELYPEATVVEFHHPGVDPAFEGLDWRSLRLVLLREAGRWWLVAVVHDEWTT